MPSLKRRGNLSIGPGHWKQMFANRGRLLFHNSGSCMNPDIGGTCNIAGERPTKYRQASLFSL